MSENPPMSPQLLDAIANDLDRVIRRVDLAIARCKGMTNAHEARLMTVGSTLPPPPLPRRNLPPED